MHREKRIFLNTLSKYLERIVFFSIGFFLTPYLLNKVGAIALGIYVLAEQILRFCTMAHNSMNLGSLRFATAHYTEQEYDKMNQVISLSMTVVLLISIPTVFILLILAFFPESLFDIPPEFAATATRVILICGVGSIATIILSFWGTSLFIKEKLYVNNIANMLTRVISALTVIYIFSVSPPSVVTWVSLVVSIGLLLNIFYVIPVSQRSLPEMKIRFRLQGVKESAELFTFSGMSFLSYVGGLLFFSTDSVIISNLNELGPQKIITYNLAQRWEPNIREFIYAFTFALAPLLTKLAVSGDTEKLKEVFFRGLRYCMLLGLFPAGMFFVYAQEFIGLWINRTMALESAPVLRVVMINLIFCIPMIMSWQLLLALNKLKGVTLLTIVGGIANIPLSIFFVKFFHLGILGVALSTLLTLGTMNLFFAPYFIHSQLHIGVLHFFTRSLFKPLLAAIAVCGLAFAMKGYWLPDTWSSLVLQIGICGPCYLVLCYCFAISGEDRQKVLLYGNNFLDKFFVRQ